MMANQTAMNLPPKDQAFVFGLIGYPLEHSLSPRLHETALKAHKLNGKYSLYPVAPFPEGEMELYELMDCIRRRKITGVNITIPHKQNIIPFIDILTPAAKAIGAVNTVFIKGNRVVGDNTDAPGFWSDVTRVIEKVNRKGSHIPPKALILGAGGSARAVAYALLTNGYTLRIAARKREQAQELCDHFSVFEKQLAVMEFNQESSRFEQYSLVVNTTPVGMFPKVDISPWNENIPLPTDCAVYDLVYNPCETLFVKQARAAGHPATSGIGMLIEQAALAFELWTSLEAPRNAMRESINATEYNNL
jgi:shikimate dehydrogenase